jgi:DNA-directed RNA polymerase subunit omega
MARITVEDCLQLIGSENRFTLIHLAIARLKQHRNGMPLLVEGKNKEVVMTLREIAAGKVTDKNLKQFAEFAKEEAAAETAALAKKAEATTAAEVDTETAKKPETAETAQTETEKPEEKAN